MLSFWIWNFYAREANTSGSGFPFADEVKHCTCENTCDIHSGKCVPTIQDPMKFHYLDKKGDFDWPFTVLEYLDKIREETEEMGLHLEIKLRPSSMNPTYQVPVRKYPRQAVVTVSYCTWSFLIFLPSWVLITIHPSAHFFICCYGQVCGMAQQRLKHVNQVQVFPLQPSINESHRNIYLRT